MKIPTQSLYQLNDERVAAINKEKRDKSVAMLGTKWLLHPANSPKSKDWHANSTLL